MMSNTWDFDFCSLNSRCSGLVPQNRLTPRLWEGLPASASSAASTSSESSMLSTNFELAAAALARRGVITGDHGYDNALLSQHATFIASGPAFRSGIVVEPIENIEIYNIMAHILGLEPAPNDGDLDRVRHMLSN